MDILLFNPYYSQTIDHYVFVAPIWPLNLLYLSGYLKKFGLASRICELSIFDPQQAVINGSRVRFGISDKAIQDIISSEHPRIIGITNMYSTAYRDVVEIATTIKHVDPTIKIVVGGNHASSYWKSVAHNPNVDFVVIGEGEETFRELCHSILENKNCSGIAGLAFRDDNGEVVKTQPRPLIKDLDTIPSPHLTLLDFVRYTGAGNPFGMRPPSAGIVSSRGCPNKCVYCTVKAVWGRTWRGRSAVNVVDEIEAIYRNYGIREFSFLDDSMGVDSDRLTKICDEIVRRSLDIKWSTPNGIAHWTLSRALLDKMKAAGCYRITFGIESGNPETRKFLGKPYPLSQAAELIRHANRIGLWTNCTNIIGFPYETLESINDTIRFAKKSGTDFACFYLLVPQPTSDVYQYFRKEGLLNYDRLLENDEFDDDEFEKMSRELNSTGADTTVFKREELMQLQKQAYRSFMIYRVLSCVVNPLRLLRKIHNAEDFFYILRMVKMGMMIFLRVLNPRYKTSAHYFYAGTTARLKSESTETKAK